MTPVEEIRAAATAMRKDAADKLTPRPWHPQVAVAVADWLDVHAEQLEFGDGNFEACDSPGDVQRALAVARAYVGGAS